MPNVGTARGGPFDTNQVVTAHEDGFVLADFAAGLWWIYDRTDDVFVCRDPEGQPVTPGGYADLEALYGDTFDIVSWSRP